MAADTLQAFFADGGQIAILRLQPRILGLDEVVDPADVLKAFWLDKYSGSRSSKDSVRYTSRSLHAAFASARTNKTSAVAAQNIADIISSQHDDFDIVSAIRSVRASGEMKMTLTWEAVPPEILPKLVSPGPLIQMTSFVSGISRETANAADTSARNNHDRTVRWIAGVLQLVLEQIKGVAGCVRLPSGRINPPCAPFVVSCID